LKTAELKEKHKKSAFISMFLLFGLWIALLREKAKLLTTHLVRIFKCF
jgi:hypothetical protein